MSFHINTFDGIAGTTYYAVRDSDRAETGTFPFRWLASLAGIFGRFHPVPGSQNKQSSTTTRDA